jgi:predicted aconitase
MDWGMLGYFVGEVVQERIPVVTGQHGPLDLMRHKHFGAAAASIGGVEMYHIVGVTPEASTLEMAFGQSEPEAVFRYGNVERRRTYDKLNANGSDPSVDFVMLGCPHYSLEQIRDVCALIDGKRISGNCTLWIFTSRAVKTDADREGYTKIIGDAGALMMTDTCSAFAQAVPPGTRVVALDSAKQAHYLPAIMGVQVWFGSTRDCIDAAIAGRWTGECS